jgi:hypothetical protein
MESIEQLHERVEAVERRARMMVRQLRWWRGLVCGLPGLAVLTWALPAVIAQEDAWERGQKRLAQRVAALEKLLKHFSRKRNQVFVTGANLHIVNGLGQTGCDNPQGEPIPDCPNGLSNLIVGYNELRTDRSLLPNVRTGSHNVVVMVVGRQHNFSRFGGLVVGDLHTISGDFASVSGGRENRATRLTDSVSGGRGQRG